MPAVAVRVAAGAAAQLDFLAGEGCRQVQAFYFSEAISAAEIERLLCEGSERIAPQVGPRRRRSA